MSCRCVRSHRIFSEKQFWHVLDRSWAAEPPLAGRSTPGGGASDIVSNTQVTPSDNRKGGHGESNECSGFGYEVKNVRLGEGAQVSVMSLCRLDAGECNCLMAFQSVGSHCEGLTGLGKAEAELRILREERRSLHSLSVDPCTSQMCNHPPAFYPAVVCCEAHQRKATLWYNGDNRSICISSRAT